jgi:hypothetical protein
MANNLPTQQSSKYRISLSEHDITIIRNALTKVISYQSEGMSVYESILYQKLGIIDYKIKAGIKKPDFIESVASQSANESKMRQASLQSKQAKGEITQEELSELNNLQFGISL